MNKHMLEFKNKLKQIVRETGQRGYEVFSDFVHFSSYAYENALLKNADVEKKYLGLVERKQYSTHQMTLMAECLALVTLAMEDDIQDYLGQIYMDDSFYNKSTGQYFTPMEVSNLMNSLLLDKSELNENEYITFNEPTVGSGAMALSHFKQVKKLGFNPQDKVFYVCQDLDGLVARIAYIQFSIIGLSGQVIIGNTLNVKEYGSYHHMFTPMYHLKNWRSRLLKSNEDSKLVSAIKDFIDMDLNAKPVNHAFEPQASFSF